MTTSSSHGALVVFGSGPGIGRHIASLFASRGFHDVVLLSRNPVRLEEDAAEVKSAAPRAFVSTVATDLSNGESLTEALAQVDGKLREHGVMVETVLFNAARVGESDVLTFSAEELERDFKLSVSSLYTVAQWIMPRFLNDMAKGRLYKPTLLVTGGFLHREPYPPLFSLSAVKAAQYNLVCTLHKMFRKSGVHCAMILVGGFVSLEAERTNPKNIAERAWELYEQSPDVREIEIVDPDWESRTKWDI
ncbi:putative short-chain alcohol protein [Lasiodiplodia theobromae]|nr:putative short-chain alcohol protein [Lasiodiplodia theobromae]